MGRRSSHAEWRNGSAVRAPGLGRFTAAEVPSKRAGGGQSPLTFTVWVVMEEMEVLSSMTPTAMVCRPPCIASFIR